MKPKWRKAGNNNRKEIKVIKMPKMLLSNFVGRLMKSIAVWWSIIKCSFDTTSYLYIAYIATQIVIIWKAIRSHKFKGQGKHFKYIRTRWFRRRLNDLLRIYVLFIYNSSVLSKVLHTSIPAHCFVHTKYVYDRYVEFSIPHAI